MGPRPPAQCAELPSVEAHQASKGLLLLSVDSRSTIAEVQPSLGLLQAAVFRNAIGLPGVSRVVGLLGIPRDEVRVLILAFFTMGAFSEQIMFAGVYIKPKPNPPQIP